jgi:IS5 family transposase
MEVKSYEEKQIYQDSCDRNAVEGEFGTCNRKYGLDRIMTKLPYTSMSTIAMGFFVANMERKLRLIFAPLFDWAIDYDPDLLSLVIFPRFLNCEVIQ